MERAPDTRPRAGRSKRDQLVDAVYRLTVKQGLPMPRLKDIAEESGISPALILYYYPEIPTLMAEMLTRVSEEFCDRRATLVSTFTDPGTKLAALISLGCLYPGRREESGRTVAVLLHVAMYDPDMSELYADFFERELSIFQQVLAEGAVDGSFTLTQDLRVAAESCLAMEDALAFLTLAGIRTPADTERSLREHAESLTQSTLPESPISPEM